MNIVSMYFPLWITHEMGGEDIDYSIALSVSMVLAGLSMPVVGAASDRLRRRLPFLVAFTLISVIATAALFISNSLVLALIIFAVANFGYQTALVPYDSMLPEVSRGRSIGMVSGLGVGLGYLGSIGGLLMVKPFVDASGRAASFIPTAVLFLVFSLPVFFLVREQGGEPTKRPLDIRRQYRKVWLTLNNTRRYPGLLRFLIANIVFSDAVNTIIVFMSIYASKVIGMDDKSIRTFLIASTVFAAAGSWLAGLLTKKFGGKRALTAALGLWLFTLLLAAGSQSVTVFWAVGPLAGVSLGGTWVASRTLVAELTPARKLGEVYGLYNLGGKFGYVIGPLVWGGIVKVFEPLGLIRYRIAVMSLALFIAAAIFVLRKVNSGKALGLSLRA
jgi:UMF1 family MFS transporter